jgi:UDP-N-acetylglucosamine 2-epimerase (non-hydrolysing)
VETTLSKKQVSLNGKNRLGTILVLFGTRPEAIKLAPVIEKLRESGVFRVRVVSSSQHTDLLVPFLEFFGIKVDHDLRVMTATQTPNEVLARILPRLDVLLNKIKPDIILVQGDTTTALAGALAGFHRKIYVGHVEAGLRSGNIRSPFPEEMNRRLISQIADFHFAATSRNRETLLSEGIPENNVFLTGNPVVDALSAIRERECESEEILRLLRETKKLKRILLTTHRRESFGSIMRENLLALRKFVADRADTCLIFPVHPNPNVRKVTREVFSKSPRIFLTEPQSYLDFVSLMKECWLIVSDSGGIQEEAPSLGKPVLILRENTERFEAIQSGIAKLVGGEPERLFEMLVENYKDESWINSVGKVANPFGDGKASERIVDILSESLAQCEVDETLIGLAH